MAGLESLIAGAGTAVLQRTYLLETMTGTGIPRLIIVLDAVQEEEPSYTADVTEHPVEAGTEVTDHIQLKNPSLRLKGTISNTPLDLATSIANLAAGGLQTITSAQARANFLNSGLQQASGAIGAKLLQGAALTGGSLLAGAADAIARSAFLSAFDRKAIFDVVTKRQKYASMVIEEMRFPRDNATGAQLVFEIQLKHIRIVSPQSVQVGTTADSVANSATSKTNLGNQATSPISDQTLQKAAAAQSATNFTQALNVFKGLA